MLALGSLFPVRMNWTNLFLSTPLNVNYDDSCSSRPSGILSHHHYTTRAQYLLDRAVSVTRHIFFPDIVAHQEAEGKHPDRPIRSDPAVAAAFVALSSPQRLHTAQPGYQENSTSPAIRPARSPRNRAEPNTRALRLIGSDGLLPPPFRNRAAAANPETHIPRIAGRPGRLWNPTNSTPRLPLTASTRHARSSRKRRPSTPPPPAVPVNHPNLEVTSVPDDQVVAGAGDYPLLTLSEQRQNRHLIPARSSLQIERRLSRDKRISVPSSVRHSYDIKRASNPPPAVDHEPGPSELKPKGGNTYTKSRHNKDQGVREQNRARAVSFGLIQSQSPDQPTPKVDKGKGKAIMLPPSNDDSTRGFSNDLERGPDILGQQHNGSSTSLPGGIGSAISSSNSSIVGDPDQPGLGEEWGPQHPCFPHLNPHVPINSTEYKTTRIIRVRRDWLIAGDLAPTFSNLYPEILDPAGVSEQEFRRVIEKLNGALIPIFNPYHWRNILDGVLGVLSGWFWEDFGLTNAKTKLNALETWIDKWNTEMEKTIGSEEGTIAPKIISLRRTGYMSLDFQIPDPEVSISNSEPGSRSGPNMPEPVALTGAPDAS
ncbi:Golgin subfamily A member 7/ERF4 family-domain-containing protein [Xylariaceae sp. FL1651]|nr:Golgin subfamily A member 7/ERF4 family-domain-containing protein [Xylariaceae sp. FL1651]